MQKWIKNIDFFLKYPDIIMDKVCEKLKQVVYQNGQVIIDIDEEVILNLTCLEYVHDSSVYGQGWSLFEACANDTSNET